MVVTSSDIYFTGTEKLGQRADPLAENVIGLVYNVCMGHVCCLALRAIGKILVFDWLYAQSRRIRKCTCMYQGIAEL